MTGDIKNPELTQNPDAGASASGVAHVGEPALVVPSAPPSPPHLQPEASRPAPKSISKTRPQKNQPWSVKGVSDTARKAARGAADAAGLSLGQWLNQVIVEAGERPDPRHMAPLIPAEPEPALPDPQPARPEILPRVAEAITALEARIGTTQTNISHTFAPLRESIEVVGVRVSALERLGDLAPGGSELPTREAIARRLSGQAPARPTTDLDDIENQLRRSARADIDTPFDDEPAKGRSVRRFAAVTSVFVVGTAAATIAVWFSLIAGPGSDRRLAARLPVEQLTELTAPAEQQATVAAADVLAIRQQAEAGNAGAQLDLAGFYLAGNGVEQDYRAAAHWLTQSATGGLAEAQYSLGLLYERGLGVNQSADRAAEWFERAAAQQYPQAQYALGIAFLEGRGKPQNYDDATIWLERAARQDHGDAQYAYAVILEDGLTADPDPDRAYEWYQAAIANGSSQAAERAALLVPRLNATPNSLPLIPSAPSPATPPTDRITLLQIEQLLTTLDFDVGTPDGILAAQTVAAIERYQSELGLPVDGKPSRDLLSHLKSVTGG